MAAFAMQLQGKTLKKLFKGEVVRTYEILEKPVHKVNAWGAEWWEVYVVCNETQKKLTIEWSASTQVEYEKQNPEFEHGSTSCVR